MFSVFNPTFSVMLPIPSLSVVSCDLIFFATEIAIHVLFFNTLRPIQKGRHFADILKCIVFNEKYPFWLKFHWNLFLRVQLTICHIGSDKGLAPKQRQAIMAYFFMHLCITRPQWVNTFSRLCTSMNMCVHLLLIFCTSRICRQNPIFSQHAKCNDHFAGATILTRHHPGQVTTTHCDAKCWHKTLSTLAQVMACRLTAPSHYLNQCWLVINVIGPLTIIWRPFHKWFLSCQINLKITELKFNANLLGANALNIRHQDSSPSNGHQDEFPNWYHCLVIVKSKLIWFWSI